MAPCKKGQKKYNLKNGKKSKKCLDNAAADAKNKENAVKVDVSEANAPPKQKTAIVKKVSSISKKKSAKGVTAAVRSAKKAITKSKLPNKKSLKNKVTSAGKAKKKSLKKKKSVGKKKKSKSGRKSGRKSGIKSGRKSGRKSGKKSGRKSGKKTRKSRKCKYGNRVNGKCPKKPYSPKTRKLRSCKYGNRVNGKCPRRKPTEKSGSLCKKNGKYGRGSYKGYCRLYPTRPKKRKSQWKKHDNLTKR